MKYILIGLMLFSTAASADYLTKDTGEVCSIPDGFNTAPYDVDFNLKGMAEECAFPHEKAIADFIGALERLKETGLDHPICEDDGGFVFGTGGDQEYPCYQLVAD